MTTRSDTREFPLRAHPNPASRPRWHSASRQRIALRPLPLVPTGASPRLLEDLQKRASETPVPLATNPRRCARQLAFTRKGPTFSISPALVTFSFRAEGRRSL